jgi:dolichol-phosphate mannosyltransferase
MSLPTESAARHNSISVVVPCYNEEVVIRQTHDRLSRAVQQTGLRYEIIYVNDGSRDPTLPVLRELQAADARVRVVSLARNFGHQVAETAGIDFATGDAVVLIDADLQDPPELIGEMVRMWRDGCEVVYGVRESRRGESAFKLFTAKYLYRLFNAISDIEIPHDTGDFRLMDRRVVDVLKSMPERDRFLRGMVSWIGFKQAPLYYTREGRAAGDTKYSLWKMLHFAGDGILSFSLLPLRLATLFGLAAATTAVLVFVVAIFARLFTGAVMTGWFLVFVAVFLLGGLTLVGLGIIGEYVGRIYHELKRRPLYVVSELYGFQQPAQAEKP